MKPEDLLVYKSNVYSQNGEDGIIQYILGKIGTPSKTCCEFGAWDGVHLSNCRNLILQGWSAVMIESDKEKSDRLALTYRDNPRVKTLRCSVDTDQNRIEDILCEYGTGELDLLSVDIDGPDYQILYDLQIRPRVICIEVNACHVPENCSLLPIEIARDNVGQPLGAFTSLARDKGYTLVCYTGNAFFVLAELAREHGLPNLQSQDAYEFYLSHLSSVEKEWLFLANQGLVPPHYRFQNQRLTARSLRIHRISAASLLAKKIGQSLMKRLKLSPQ